MLYERMCNDYYYHECCLSTISPAMFLVPGTADSVIQPDNTNAVTLFPQDHAYASTSFVSVGAGDTSDLIPELHHLCFRAVAAR